MNEKDRIRMSRSKRGSQQLVAWLAAASLVVAASLAACTSEQAAHLEQADLSELLTVQPEMALTLTAWPSPLPILTLPPTPSAAPQALWTAEQIDTPTSTDEPEPTAAIATASPETTVQPPQVSAAELGSNARPTQLQIPQIGLDVPVVEVSWQVVFEGDEWYSQWQTVDEAAGHHRTSANPGELGNVVVSGHHNTGTEVFRDLSEIGMPGSPLGEGTEVILVTNDGDQYTYTVSQWERIQIENVPRTQRQEYARYMEPSNSPILTLITCWPYEGRSHRVIVVGELQP
jgi:sortase A